VSACHCWPDAHKLEPGVCSCLPLPCPQCLRTPKLRESFEYGRGYQPPAHHFWLECRRWFGLRLCLASAPTRIEKGWADLGIRTAIARWNRLALARKAGFEVRVLEAPQSAGKG